MNSKQKNKIIDIQLGRKQIYPGLNELRNNWGYKSIEEAINQIVNSNTKSCQTYRNSLLPKTYEVLGNGILFRYLPDEFEHELNWYVAHINNFREQINVYLKYRNEYENNLFLGEYNRALEVLNKIDSEICVSIWGLDNHFVLAEYRSGLEKNKELLASINANKCDRWISILADLFSFKAEKGVNNRQYNHRIEKLFAGVSDGIRSYFEEKLYSINGISSKNMYDLLYYNENASILDIYNVFLNVCIRTAADNNSYDATKGMIKNAVKKINGISDIVLDKLRYFFDYTNEMEMNDFDRQMYKLGNLYTEGKYRDAIELCNVLFEKHANCFELYEYYVKSHIMMDEKLKTISEKSISQDLADSMYTAYIKDKQISQSYAGLCRIERIFSNSNFSAGIEDFIVDKYMIGNSKIQTYSKELFSPFLNIKFVNVFEDNTESVLSNLERGLGKGSSIELYKLINSKENQCESLEIDRNRYRWYKIKSINSKSEKCEELEAWYKEICSYKGDFERYQKERISTELFYLYIDENKILEAENLYVKNRLENKYSILRMDLKEIFNAIKVGDELIKKSICTPIICYLCNQNNYAEIYSYTANFMELNGLEKPSDICEIYQMFDRDELIFFLRYVCTNEILDSMYFVFDNEDQVETERIEICLFLQKIDRDNEGEYIDEISHLLKNKQIMQGVIYIEDAKIDLNVDKILEQYRSVFYDNFKRFKQIGELDIEYKVFDLTNNLIYVKNSTDRKKYNHKLMIFKEMLLDFRDEFAFGKYGLDQSIGTRIRHGSLQNQLRVVFEKSNIIFVKKSTKDSSYIPSAKFLEMCKNIDNKSEEKLCEYISCFSEKIDLYLETLKSEFIRIKTEELNATGLIDLRVKSNELILLFEEAQEINNENLILEKFELFWLEKIKEGLEDARQFFDVSVKKEFISMLSNLEEDLHSISVIENMHYNLFDSISRSRTEIQNSVNMVSGWFKLPTKQVYAEFSANTLIETCEIIYKRVFLNYTSIEVNKKIESEIKIQGKYFSYFVDILIIIFTNAYYHSGYIDNTSSLQIDFEIIDKKDFYFISVKNNLSDNIIIDELNEKVQEIQRKINQSICTGQYSNFEGGSGLIKICKILEWNVGTKWFLEFGLDDDEKHFFTKIGIDSNSILVKETNKNENYSSRG